MQIEQITTLTGLSNPADAASNKPRLMIPDHELIRRIGGGAYGEVWLARNVLGGYRAVKAVFRTSFKTEEPYEREFRGIQRCEPISRSNEGLVDILQVGRNDAEGYFYYVMELADDSNAECGMRSAESREDDKTGRGQNGTQTPPGLRVVPSSYEARTLRSEIQRRGRLPPDECIQLGINLSLALAHLHRNGLIHRDIKPANIIFVGGMPKLADIGLVTDLSDAQSFVGTEGFIPPEGPNTPQADIYSLGKVLYEISMGKDRNDFPEPATLIGEGEESESLEELNSVVLKACASNSMDRYQTAEELIADLALLNSGKSVKWKRVVERRLDWAKKVAGTAAVLATIATAAYLVQRQQTREARRNLYLANMSLAQQDWDKANLERLSRLLDETKSFPDKGFEWSYWQYQLHLDLKTLRGPNGGVFSPDGQKLLTPSDDHSARVWDITTGRQLLQLEGHGARVTTAAFSPNGRKIVTGSWDGTARAWDTSTGRQLLEIAGHTGMVMGVAISPDGQYIAIVSRYSNGALAARIAVWDARAGEQLRTFGENTSGLGAVAFSPDGQRIAAGADRFTVKVWEVGSGQEIFTCRSEADVNAFAFSPDGKRLATASSNEVGVWDTSSREQVYRLRGGHQLSVQTLAYSPDGRKIATAGDDQRLVVWDAAAGAELFRLLGHRAPLTSVAFSTDGQQLASASGDGTVKIWDACEVPNPRTFPTQTKEVNMLAFSPDGRRIATTTWDKTVRIWEVATGRVLLALPGIADEVTHIAFSPDGQRLATGNGWNGRWGAGHAKIWDCATGKELLILEGNGFVAFSPDGHRIATSSSNSTATIWDATTGRKLVTLHGHADWVECGAFSPLGNRIASACGDTTAKSNGERTVKVWDAETGRELCSIKRYKSDNDISSCVTFSPDGKRIAFAGNDRTPRVWDASTGRELLALNGHKNFVTSIAFSPDGKRILTAGYDRSAKLWDAFTGRELLTLDGHTRMVRTAAFSPDGRSIATAGYDGLIKIWEAASSQQVNAWQKEVQMGQSFLTSSGLK